MIFQKKHRKSVLHKLCFGINKHNIEIVDNYTYTHAVTWISQKYDITKLFNSLFLPIPLYGSEIW